MTGRRGSPTSQCVKKVLGGLVPDRKEIDIAAQKAGNSSYPMGKIFDKTVPCVN